MSDSLLVSGRPARRALAKSMNQIFGRILHVIGYYALLKRPGTRLARIAGFDLTIRPTVYDPRFYRAPAFFSEFISGLDLSGKAVADLGTGSGIQSLTAARAGASRVVAIGVTADAAVTAATNARATGFSDRVFTFASSMFSAMTSRPQFTAILTTRPFSA